MINATWAHLIDSYTFHFIFAIQWTTTHTCHMWIYTLKKNWNRQMRCFPCLNKIYKEILKLILLSCEKERNREMKEKNIHTPLKNFENQNIHLKVDFYVRFKEFLLFRNNSCDWICIYKFLSKNMWWNLWIIFLFGLHVDRYTNHRHFFQLSHSLFF